MSERRLYVEPEAWSPDAVVVQGEQARHLKQVLRASAGDTFEFIDGAGRWARAVVESVPTRGEVRCRIEEQRIQPPPPRDQFVLLQALIRFEKFEWILEKATELGVTLIVPFMSAHTESKWRLVPDSRRERWNKILIESIKQCRRLHLPALNPPVRFDRAILDCGAPFKIFLDEKPLTPSLKSVGRSYGRGESGQSDAGLGSKVALAIGPEGGWSREEAAFAEHRGFRPASLGDVILRAETAAIAAMAIVQYEFGS